VATLLLATLLGLLGAQRPSQSLPEAFEKYLAAEVRPTTTERAALLSGAPLTELLPSDQSKEVFVFGAVWIDASPSKYIRQVKDIENFEKGGAFPYYQEDQRSSDVRRLRADGTA